MDGVNQFGLHPTRLTSPHADSGFRRLSADSQASRSRRGSSEMSARLEVELRSHVFHHSAVQGAESPAPFPPCFSGDITEDLEAQPDDKVTISCAVHGHPRPEVAWYKDGVLVMQNSHGIELWSQGELHNLVVPYIGHEHAGVYCIVAVNPLGRSECHCILRVVDEPSADSGVDETPSHPLLPTPTTAPVTPAHGCCSAGCQLPPELLSLFRDKFCRVGDPVLLECEVSAGPAPLVSWSFNGRPINAADARFRISSYRQKHRLTIVSVDPSDAGRIFFTAENDAGVASCGALLIVEDPEHNTVCSQKVIRIATHLYNKRPGVPTEAWRETPSYLLVA